ncbi:hypothetical protein [Rhodococcus rhodochrous]|uniref:Uncharacterized protein n=1 Tax=Rhodococcus rhodochrous TaxID=1829 RepID=A0AA47AED7_RHORH|nr:hypothetical protein [Rhodococcus rhodochrous]UZF48260.1 hypothetical protein KUM34_028340 [Rhodococcus rhodochrous]
MWFDTTREETDPLPSIEDLVSIDVLAEPALLPAGEIEPIHLAFDLNDPALFVRHNRLPGR